MNRFSQIMLLMLILAGCSVKYLPVVSSDTVQVVSVVVRDSIVTLPTDSAMIKAWFECDSLNHVIMTELESSAGENIKPVTSFTQGKLIVTAKVDSQSVYLSWKERHDTTKVKQVSIKEVEVEKIVYRKPKWLKTLAGVGIGSLVLLILMIIKKFK